MPLHRVATALAAAAFLAGTAASLAAEPINIENWPDDVPCNVLKKDADGTYEITVQWARFFQVHAAGTKYRNTRETKYWDQKCKGQTQ